MTSVARGVGRAGSMVGRDRGEERALKELKSYVRMCVGGEWEGG